MSVLSIFKKGSHSPYHEMARDYQKKASKAFRIFTDYFPDHTKHVCYAVPIKTLNYKERKIELDFDIEKEIFYSDCKSEDELYANKEFDRPSNMKKSGCYYQGRSELEEVLPIVDELKKLGFHPMWRYDEEHNDYVLFPVFFEK